MEQPPVSSSAVPSPGRAVAACAAALPGWASLRLSGIARAVRGLGPHLGECAGTALMSCLVASLLASATAVASLVTTIRIGPPVGEILHFQPGADLPQDWRIPVSNLAGGSCVVQPATLLASGGSLVVEQRLHDGWTYRVHWAGGPTASGAADCGRAADLEIGRTAMQALVNLAGGLGGRWGLSGS